MAAAEDAINDAAMELLVTWADLPKAQGLLTVRDDRIQLMKVEVKDTDFT